MSRTTSTTTLWLIAWLFVGSFMLTTPAWAKPILPRSIAIIASRTTSSTPPTPTLSVVKRNNANVPSGATGLTATPTTAPTVVAQQQSASSTASSASSASTSALPPGGGFGSLFGSGVPATFLTWIAVVVVIGIALSLLVARYFYIKRYYKPTFRSYFLPPNGLHIKRLGIHIRAPPARIPREPPPSYGVAELTGRNGRRRRRDRTTVGEQIGEGGRRLGDRDEDDAFDDAAQGGAARDELPMYTMDTGLPAYGTVAGEREQAQLQQALEASRQGNHDSSVTRGAATATTPMAVANSAALGEQQDDDAQIPSVQEYERLTREARDAAAATGPGLPPRAIRSLSSRSHQHGPASLSRADSDVGHGQYPPRPVGFLAMRSSSNRSVERHRFETMSEAGSTNEEAGDHNSTLTGNTSTSSTCTSSHGGGLVKLDDAKIHPQQQHMNGSPLASTSQSRIDKEEDDADAEISSGDAQEMTERRQSRDLDDTATDPLSR
ncbi:hypothetical protein OIO90_004363 [Microbotryomycetes sp. JL221]|nr:hypothetical protein OIO90_004363 [Microbotryomycetes sp. JL221]